MDRPLTAVLHAAFRTSDRTAGGPRGAQALAEAMAVRLQVAAERAGAPSPPATGHWSDDLDGCRADLRALGAACAALVAGGRRPLVFASDCSICLATLPAVSATRVLWLDAHGDFNTPATTPSDFLGGMCLAGACGRWDAGVAATPLDPARVIVAGARDLDAGERAELQAAGVRLAPLADAAALVAGERVAVHLDLDVLSGEVMPAQFPAAGGASVEELIGVLRDVAAQAGELVLIEVTAFELPAAGAEALVERMADVVSALVS